MIDLSLRRNPTAARTLKIIGLGGAGANVLDRMVLDGVLPEHLVAVHSDAQILNASVAGGKIQLGREATRGLGAGGDPDLGRAAAEEASRELDEALEGVDGVFLVAGLGGGTGSGGAAVVSERAKAQGALVIAFVTLPFGFEGKRRAAQADEGLAALSQWADAVICFENDRMGDQVPPSAGIAQAFAATDQTLSAAVRAIAGLLARKGLIHLGFADLRAALGGTAGRCLFGYGEAEGSNRPFEALTAALRNPLMDKGRMLRECRTVLVSVSGGDDLTLNEVQLLMEELNRMVPEQARLLFGTSVDPSLSGRLSVTILTAFDGERRQPEISVAASRRGTPEPEPPVVAFTEPEDRAPESVPERCEEPEPEEAPAFVPEEETAAPVEAVLREEPPMPEEEPDLFAARTVFVPLEEPEELQKEGEAAAPAEEEMASARSAPEPERPAPRVTRPVPGRTLQPNPSPRSEEPKEKGSAEPPGAEPAAAGGGASRTPQQETLKFEPVTRGRFEKSEPTIVDGEDLDVPTFLRRNFRIRS